MTKIHVLSGVIVFVALGLSGGWYFHADSLKKDIESLEATNRDISAELASTTISLEGKIAELSGSLTASEDERVELKENLSDEKDRNDDFEEQIEEIAGTVGILDKLSKTDEELLQKYSKVYFLNEHYVPESLKEIKKENLYDESRTEYLHTKTIPFFEEMVKDAKDDEIDLWVVSAYRSFETQAQLKGSYLVTYGTGANAFSADQGFSEHQLGTTIDFTTRGINGGLAGFQNTDAYTWLLTNAHKYGFTLSYPENNSFYIFEPWHWRYVGEDLARDLKKDGASFYGWDQRRIDTYLISIFD